MPSLIRRRCHHHIYRRNHSYSFRFNFLTIITIFLSSSNLHKINNLSHRTRSSRTPSPFSSSSLPHTIVIFTSMIRSSHPHPHRSPLRWPDAPLSPSTTYIDVRRALPVPLSSSVSKLVDSRKCQHHLNKWK